MVANKPALATPDVENGDVKSAMVTVLFGPAVVVIYPLWAAHWSERRNPILRGSGGDLSPSTPPIGHHCAPHNMPLAANLEQPASLLTESGRLRRNDAEGRK